MVQMGWSFCVKLASNVHAVSPGSVLVMRITFFRDLIEAVTEQVQYHELLLQMTRRDLLLRYKQTVLGFGWAIFMPLLNTLVFSVVFMRVAPVETSVPYPLFAFCGLLFWNFSASSFRFAVNSLTSNGSLVTKVYFPRELLPTSAVVVSLVDLAVGAVVLVAMAAYYDIAPTRTLVALPLVLAVQIVFTVAVALVLAMANLFYRDVKYLFEIVLMVWMFATSVVYPIDGLQGRTRFLLELNPMTPIIEAYRDVLLMGRWPGTGFAVAAAATLVFAACAVVVFHRAESTFVENI